MEKEVNIQVEGMTCTNCAKTVEKVLEKNGATDITVDFVNNLAVFKANPDNTNLYIDAVNKIGYKASIPRKDGKLSSTSPLLFQLVLSAAFTIPLMLHMFLPHDNVLNLPLTQLLLCIPPLIIGILRFGRSSFEALKLGTTNMDVLVFIGFSSAFIYSCYGAFFVAGNAHNFLFFETAASIITLVLLGNYLEEKSVKKTTEAVSELKKLKVNHAKKVLFENNQTKMVETEIDLFHVGDVFSINEGDAVPLDGELISGFMMVNEAMVTGESLPSEKKAGDILISGSVVISGNGQVKVTRIASQSTVQQIIDFVQKAQSDKPNIQRLADRVSAVFVPIVLLISLGTFLFWYFGMNEAFQICLLNAISVLVISCPCAMGLATPTAIVVALGRAAKMGIVVKGASTLEKLADVKTVLMDKTGTITTAEFKVTEWLVLDKTKEDEIKNILFSIQKNSSHPIAKSICKFLEKDSKLIPLQQLEEKKGKGMTAEWNGNKYSIISERSAQEIIVDIQKGYALYLFKNKELIALVKMEDKLKSGVKEVLNWFDDNKIEYNLLSGDKTENVSAIANSLGIKNYRAEMMPEKKYAFLEDKLKVGTVAMIGDGINDAPSLAKATVGISFSNGTDIAQQTSQILLMGDQNFAQLQQVFSLSKVTLRTIKQNLFWAFFYNVVAIPIAAAGFLNPMIGALAMAFSDVIVVGNSIWLKRKKLS